MQIFAAIGRFLFNLTLKYGVVGLAAGTFLESFGIPTAAAVLELAAGILILSGRATFIEVLIVADLGLVLGSLAAYQVGRAGKTIFERWHRHPPDEAERQSRARQLIERYGDESILLAQLFGPARTWVSYPAGAMGMNLKKFIIYTAVGGAVYCAAVISLSLHFTKFIQNRFNDIVNWLTLPVVAGLMLGVVLLFFVHRWWKARVAK